MTSPQAGFDLAWVGIELGDGRLTVTVRDPGPMAGTWTPGVGISSMR